MYEGETERSLKAIFNEHHRPSSATSEVEIHIHFDQPHYSMDNTKIFTKQSQSPEGLKDW